MFKPFSDLVAGDCYTFLCKGVASQLKPPVEPGFDVFLHVRGVDQSGTMMEAIGDLYCNGKRLDYTNWDNDEGFHAFSDKSFPAEVFTLAEVLAGAVSVQEEHFVNA